MASRKKEPPIEQASFFAPKPDIEPASQAAALRLFQQQVQQEHARARAEGMKLDWLPEETPIDGTKESSIVEYAPEAERPKLRLVHSQPEEDVTVEPTEDGRFECAIIKAHGGTRLGVMYTRKQLEMLLRRIPAALALEEK